MKRASLIELIVYSSILESWVLCVVLSTIYLRSFLVKMDHNIFFDIWFIKAILDQTSIMIFHNQDSFLILEGDKYE